jgi:hypothetical protein
MDVEGPNGSHQANGSQRVRCVSCAIKKKNVCHVPILIGKKWPKLAYGSQLIRGHPQATWPPARGWVAVVNQKASNS